jgi:regulatory protein
MAVIKEIVQSDKQKEYVTIVTDEYSFLLNKEICYNERLQAGMPLNKEKYERLLSENENKAAFICALKYISRKKCSQKMVEEYLKEKGFGQKPTDYAVNKLKDYRYIDDMEYACCYVNWYGAQKGRKKIACELKNKGISEEIIQNLSKDDDSEIECCAAAAQKFIKDNDIKDIKIRQKVIRHLMYKGFEYEIIKSALFKLGEEIET